MGQEKYRDGFKVTLHRDALELPISWKKPRVVFVNSMSDLFHEDVPLEFIGKVFDTMNRTPQHTYQILTKRAERLAELANHFSWTDNIWMGVSVERKRYYSRIDSLREVPAKTRFLSLEPLIEALPNMNLKDIGWVIVGGESGPGARPMESEWVIDIKKQCLNSNTPFFFKQWGGTNKKASGRELEGRTWDEMPVEAALAE